MPIVDDIRLHLSADALRRRRTLSVAGKRSARIDALVDELLVEAEAMLAPAVAFETHRLAAVEGSDMVLGDGTRLGDARMLVRRLGGAAELAIAVATIGGALEQEVSRLFAARQAMRALVLEEIGIAAAYALGDAAHEAICGHAAAHGLDASSPLSPGSTGVPLVLQKRIIDLAGGARIGVRVTETAMMTPVNSVSMIIGLGRDMPKWSRAKACNRCGARDTCRHRVFEDAAQ